MLGVGVHTRATLPLTSLTGHHIGIDLTGNTLKQEIARETPRANIWHDGGVRAQRCHTLAQALNGNDIPRIQVPATSFVESSTQGAADRVQPQSMTRSVWGSSIELLTTNGSRRTATSTSTLPATTIALRNSRQNAGDNRRLEGKGGSDALRGLRCAKTPLVFAYRARPRKRSYDVPDFNLDGHLVPSDRRDLHQAEPRVMLSGYLPGQHETRLAQDPNDSRHLRDRALARRKQLCASITDGPRAVRPRISSPPSSPLASP